MKFKRNSKLTKKRGGRKVKKNMRNTKYRPLIFKKRSRMNRKRSRRGGMFRGINTRSNNNTSVTTATHHTDGLGVNHDNKAAKLVIEAILSDITDPNVRYQFEKNEDYLAEQIVTIVGSGQENRNTSLEREMLNEFNTIDISNINEEKRKLLIRYAIASIPIVQYTLGRSWLKLRVTNILKNVIYKLIHFHDTDAGTGNWENNR